MFQPDLIIEATATCDRACAGCYAPNVTVAKSDAAVFYSEHPELFLNPNVVETSLSALPRTPTLISIRGGEPTQHPELAAIIQSCLKHAKTVVLETHGRWLLPKDVAHYKALLPVLMQSNVVIKLSFDQMHGLSVDDLKTITDILGFNNLQYLIAITEPDDASLRSSRARCSWIPDDNIVYQPKAATLKDLTAPPLGVLTVKGSLVRTLTVKQTFLAISNVNNREESRLAI